MNKGRLKRLVRSWWRHYGRCQKLSDAHMSIMIDNEVFFDDPTELVERGWDPAEAQKFVKERCREELRAKNLCRNESKRLSRLQRRIPEILLEDLREIWHEREAARLNRELERMKEKGLAVSLSDGSLMTFSSPQCRRQWEQECPEQAALIV